MSKQMSYIASITLEIIHNRTLRDVANVIFSA